MNKTVIWRIAKIIVGLVGTLLNSFAAINGNLALSLEDLIIQPMSTIFILAVIFSFPYLMMSSIIKHEYETETASLEKGGILKSYGEQNNATKRYRKHMIRLCLA